jgi:DNA-binding NarL/FixJ family response regulator
MSSGSGKTKVLSEIAIDLRLAKNKAQHIKPDSIHCDENPAVQALPEIEREIWKMHCQGVMGKEIAQILGLRKDEVSRALNGIRAKLQFLVAFRITLEQQPLLREKYFKNCAENL